MFCVQKDCSCFNFCCSPEVMKTVNPSTFAHTTPSHFTSTSTSAKSLQAYTKAPELKTIIWVPDHQNSPFFFHILGWDLCPLPQMPKLLGLPHDRNLLPPGWQSTTLIWHSYHCYETSNFSFSFKIRRDILSLTQIHPILYNPISSTFEQR